eukprot:CAMPEP_0198732272 /NCGR_PEP_ID=MMETSP1475-20131203/34741_1 /TAXON_ID= ORGANISM="Unidentified sp., Strain CCMP1999" /NCGR_SAMPLE_ID=MMETSP1475 /ASSEMBLY_ACC=CAM_ASM_001111 /LENGTH=244 /DNA_ID=CAMNT_0044495341 /DNA_START=204 /DNA_END=939 /DNA_ORIENTATION=-
MKFDYPYILRLHSRKHGDEKPHKCQEANCGKSFKWRTSLLAHEKSHSSGRLRPSKGQDKAGVRDTDKRSKKSKLDKTKGELVEPKSLSGEQTAGSADVTSVMSLLPSAGDDGAYETLEVTQQEEPSVNMIDPVSETTPVVCKNADDGFDTGQVFDGPNAMAARDDVDSFGPLWEPYNDKERGFDIQGNAYWSGEMIFGLPVEGELTRLNPTEELLDGEVLSQYTYSNNFERQQEDGVDRGAKQL